MGTNKVNQVAEHKNNTMNQFKFDKSKKELWLDIPDPGRATLVQWADYNNRLHYTVSPELDKLLEDGQVLKENEFALTRWESEFKGKYHYSTPLIAIPLPEAKSIAFDDTMYRQFPGQKGSDITLDNEQEEILNFLKSGTSAESLLKEYWILVSTKKVENHKDDYINWYKKLESFIKGMPEQTNKPQEDKTAAQKSEQLTPVQQCTCNNSFRAAHGLCYNCPFDKTEDAQKSYNSYSTPTPLEAGKTIEQCQHTGKINSGHHADQPSWCDECGEEL